MSGFSTLGGGGGVKIKGLYIAKTVAELASWFNEVDPIVGAVYIEKKPEMTAPLVAAIFNHDNLSVDKAVAIFDDVNLSVAKLADIFGHANLSNSRATDIFNNMARAIDDIASVFNDVDVPADKVAYVFENTTKSVDYLASILDSANLSEDKAASILDSANLSADKTASICDSPNISSSRLKAILDTGKLTDADKIAAILDGDSLTADDAASHIESEVYTVDTYAFAFDSNYLSADKAASILDNANLSETKLQAILDNENLSIQRGQEIVDAMSNKEKIGTGGRRGFLGDDWEDNKLTNRDRATVVATTLDRIFQKFRPEWDTVSGTPKVSNGRLFFDNSLEMQVPSDFVVGAWQFKFEWSESSDTDESYCYIKFMYVDANNAYFLKLDAFVRGASWNGLRKIVNGNTEALLNFAIDLGEHTIKITRDSNGNFEVFYDGVSKGTATDTDITTSNYINIEYTQKTYGNLYLDDLEVY